MVVFLAAAAGPAKAGPPEIFTEPREGYLDFDCGTYTVRYEWEGIARLVAHWDQGFVNIHHDLNDAFYRMDGVGERYTHVEQNAFIDTNDGLAIYGILFHVVIPSSGSVITVTGYYFFDYEKQTFTIGHGNFNIAPDSVSAAFAEE